MRAKRARLARGFVTLVITFMAAAWTSSTAESKRDSSGRRIRAARGFGLIAVHQITSGVQDEILAMVSANVARLQDARQGVTAAVLHGGQAASSPTGAHGWPFGVHDVE